MISLRGEHWAHTCESYQENPHARPQINSLSLRFLCCHNICKVGVFKSKETELAVSSSHGRYVGVMWFAFSCSPTPTDKIYTRKWSIQQIYDEASTKIGPPMIYLWLTKPHVCWILNFCMFTLEWNNYSESVIQSLLRTCLYGACSLILADSQQSHVGVELRKATK